MTYHNEAYRSPERVRARSEAQRKAARRRWDRMAEAMAAVQLLLDAGFVTATYKKGTKLSARNLVGITLTDEGKQVLRSIRAGDVAIRTVNEGLKKGWYEWAAPQEEAETSEMSRIEIWRPVVGYEGLYEVSNFGHVRSLDRMSPVNYRPGVTFIRKGRLLKPIWDGKYLVVRLFDHQHRKTGFLIHRLVADAFVPRPSGMTRIRHRDGDNLNNSVDNLEWSNDSILQRRDFAAGRSRRASGEDSGQAKLTWAIVDEMRRKHQHGEGSMHSLAREYGVAYATARNVINEITWKKEAA